MQLSMERIVQQISDTSRRHEYDEYPSTNRWISPIRDRIHRVEHFRTFVDPYTRNSSSDRFRLVRTRRASPIPARYALIHRRSRRLLASEDPRILSIPCRRHNVACRTPWFQLGSGWGELAGILEKISFSCQNIKFSDKNYQKMRILRWKLRKNSVFLSKYRIF